ncbi:predicted protein [Lichtheimia corymbifera JMRC:FSU:9682]|uniref:Uncharacterized protein n=1 Tax=Lichtheimia corymbifera JMRC:FSU:9682 TaxID=1263082 RepID=A0A068RMJ0_9FUNG|nr:predicted protein [Lichtheimia corymbifera JMRC:FSU:9682]
MSSLIETTNKEDVPVSAVQPISGCNLPVNTLSRTRSYTAYNLTDLNGVKVDTMSRRLQRTSESSLLRLEETSATTTTTAECIATTTATESRASDNETKSQEGLEEFISMLAGNGTRKDPNDTINEATANIDHLLAIMKSRQMGRDTLHHIPPEEYHPSNNNNTIFNFMFESNKSSLSTNNTDDNADSKPSALSPSDFRFSFTSKEPLATSSPRSNINIRRYRGGGGKITTPNVFYSTAYDDEDGDDDDEQNEYESDDGQTNAQHSRHSGSMIPTNSDISKLPQHLQHRKILPLPKPRWKRKGLQKATSNDKDQQQSANNNTTSSSSSPPLTPYIWQFSPPAREIQQRYSEHEDWGMSRLSLADDPNCLFQEVFTGDDSSYRDNAKKMKRSTGSESTSLPSAEYDERKSTLRRKDRKWRNNSNNSSSHSNNIAADGSRITPGIQLPESAFDFAMDKRTRDQLKGLPTLDDLPRPKSASLGLSNVLRQAMTPVAPSITPPLPPPAPPSASSTTKSTIASPPPPPPPHSSTLTQSLPTVTARAKRNESISTATTKKKGKANDHHPNEPSKTIVDKPVTVSSANTKRGKKGSRKKKVNDDDSHNKSNQALVSDIALIRNPDPDEWICVFCQYEILCRGLEAARRKGGYYRRRRERRRRLREVEARRAGECISGATSDFEDDPPVIDDLTHGPLPPPPPPPPLPPSIPPTSTTTDAISTPYSTTTTATTPTTTMDHRHHHQRKGKGNRVA